MAKLGIIGGSGLYQLDLKGPVEKISVETPFGKPSGDFTKYTTDIGEVFFLPRHGEGHRLLPSEINYRANIFGFKKLGVSAVVSIGAVGSMRKEIEPGHFVIPDQYIDHTKGLRKNTFFGEGIVAHAHFSTPICPSWKKHVSTLCRSIDIPIHEGGTYLCMEGPQFSTYAESEQYRNWNLNKTHINVIGMTAMPEAKLAREAGFCYLTVAMATDYDCWNDEVAAVTADQVLKVMHQNVQKSKNLVVNLLSNPLPNCDSFCKDSMKHAIVTPKSHWPENKISMIETLLS